MNHEMAKRLMMTVAAVAVAFGAWVIELNAVNFKPELMGQLGFYMVAVDRQLKNEWAAPTVGHVLCRDGNRTVVEYALSVTDKLEAA